MGVREGEPLRDGNLKVWRHVGQETGAKAISLRTLEVARGVSPGLRNASCDEVLYVLEGEGVVFLDGRSHPVAPLTGIYLPPGVTLTVENPGPEPLTIVSSQCPDPGPLVAFEPPRLQAGATACAAPPPVRFEDQETHAADDQRWFRVLVDEEVGSTRVTQFVGAIPPGRAPDHYHDHEEVICILEGTGRMWAGKTRTSVHPGLCVFLPLGQPHCLENTGNEELRLFGAFSPSGSPASRYYPRTPTP